MNFKFQRAARIVDLICFVSVVATLRFIRSSNFRNKKYPYEKKGC